MLKAIWNWMKERASSLWEKIRTEPLLSFLIFLLVLLTGLLVFVMFCETCKEWVGERLGLYKKNNILKFLGISMGGVLLTLQALMSYKRAKAMEDTARAQVEANENTEQGQRQERLKNAIEHLGHDKDSVRLGGAYELFHLAEDTAKDKKDLRQSILNILCAHIRQTTGEAEYREKYKSKPSEEVQSLLTLLFVQKHDVFKGCHINLQGSWLNGADLRGARLVRAVLTGTYLQGAELEEARLQGADLIGTQLQGSVLMLADLLGADLRGGQLQGADLSGASLPGAVFGVAQNKDFSKSSLGASGLLQRVVQTQLQGAGLVGTFLLGITRKKSRSDSFEEHIRSRIGEENDLRGTIFAGGLIQEEVDSCVKGLSDGAAESLRSILESHVGKPPSFELPKDSLAILAITGTYTAEEAEQWIAEYNEAMSEVPEESDN